MFNELLWACDGTAWDTVGCLSLRDAIFCLSNYYIIDRLNYKRGFSKSTWIERDGSDLGMLVRCCAYSYATVNAIADLVLLVWCLVYLFSARKREAISNTEVVQQFIAINA